MSAWLSNRCAGGGGGVYATAAVLEPQCAGHRAPAVCPLPGVTATLRPAPSCWPCSPRGMLGACRSWLVPVASPDCLTLCGLRYTRGSLGSFSTPWVSPSGTEIYWVLASPRPAKSGLSSPQDPRCLAHFKVWEALGAGTQQSSVQRDRCQGARGGHVSKRNHLTCAVPSAGGIQIMGLPVLRRPSRAE